jgi:hypothetical protein
VRKTRIGGVHGVSLGFLYCDEYFVGLRAYLTYIIPVKLITNSQSIINYRQGRIK